jgi:hypothetical protein
VAWELLTCFEAVELWVALHRIGATQVPVIAIYRDREVIHCCRKTGARWLVTSDEFRGYDFIGMGARLAAELGLGFGHVVLATGTVHTGDTTRLPPPRTHPDAPRWIFYASGMTALPKGVRPTDRSLSKVGAAMGGDAPRSRRPLLAGHPVSPHRRHPTGLQHSARRVHPSAGRGGRFRVEPTVPRSRRGHPRRDRNAMPLRLPGGTPSRPRAAPAKTTRSPPVGTPHQRLGSSSSRFIAASMPAATSHQGIALLFARYRHHQHSTVTGRFNAHRRGLHQLDSDSGDRRSALARSIAEPVLSSRPDLYWKERLHSAHAISHSTRHKSSFHRFEQLPRCLTRSHLHPQPRYSNTRSEQIGGDR